MRGWTFLAVLGLLTSGCGGGSGGPSDPSPGGGNTVTVGNNTYSPAALSVAAGTTVTWTWAANAVQHTVTFADQSSPAQSTGTFPRTFASAGTYPYFCTIHGAAVMSGTVTVTSAGGSGSGGSGGGGGGGSGGGGYGSP